MPEWISRTVLYAALCVGLLSAATVAQAQEAAADPLRARAQRSLVGPSITLGSGLALILAAPAVSIAIVATSMDWSQDDSSSGQDDAVVAYGLGIGMTLVGSALTAWGATQVAQIRSARRRLAYVEGAGFELARGGAQLSLRFRY